MLRRWFVLLLLFGLYAGLSSDLSLAQPKNGIAKPANKGKNKSPFEGYTLHKLENFTVFVQDKVYEVEKTTKKDVTPLEALEIELKTIVKVFPEKYVKEIRKLPVFVEWSLEEPDKPGNVIAYYTTLGHRVEGNHFVILRMDYITRQHQPEIEDPQCICLHEFAHAVDHAIYNFQAPFVKKAYEAAMDRGLYGGRSPKGMPSKVYAATSASEYFAELTCAYLDKGAKPIVTRAELKEYDAEGYKAMEQVWGKNPERFVIRTRAKTSPVTPPVNKDKEKEIAKSKPAPMPEPKEKTAEDLEKQADAKLRTIDFLIKAGKKEAAKEKIEELLKQHPGSKAAEKALELKKGI